MPERSERFDADSVREEWDAAAGAYAEAQATGRDFYRLELFGPAQIEFCGEVRGSWRTPGQDVRSETHQESNRTRAVSGPFNG